MKFHDFHKLINNIPKGFIICWDCLDGGIIRSEHTPEYFYNEKLIDTQDKALELAHLLSKVDPKKYVNIKVTGINIYNCINGKEYGDTLNKYYYYKK